MTVIVWDGKIIAADSLAVNGSRKRRVKKWRELDNGTVLLWTGDHEEGLVLCQWFENGCKPEDLPKHETREEYTILIVLLTSGHVVQYQIERIAEPIEAPHAWGDGAPYAMAAMAMGADAARAAEVACDLSIYCGRPIQIFARHGY